MHVHNFVRPNYLVRSVMPYVSKTWPVKEGKATKLQRNDARMIRRMCNVRPEKLEQAAIKYKYYAGIFTKQKITMVWSSRKNGRKFLAQQMLKVSDWWYCI